MKHQKLIRLATLSICLMTSVSFAQTSTIAQGDFEEEISSEIDGISTSTAEASSGDQVQVVNVEAQPTVTLRADTGGRQVIQVHKQPTTVIEDSPLSDSKSDRIRRARQEQELMTEQAIVEKLEQSRIEDEKRRADILFGNKFDQLGSGASAAPIPAPTVQEVAPAPGIDRESIRGEIQAELDARAAANKEPESRPYFSGLVGVGEYPDAVNVTGQYALGFAIGQTFQDRIQAELAFVYSNYQVEQRQGYTDFNSGIYYPRITEMDQYAGSVALKYQLLNGMLRPVVGGLMSYNYRTFTDTQFSFYDTSATSQAIDIGLITGVDVALNKDFSLGVDFRYMRNLTSRSEGGFQSNYLRPYLVNESPIEKLSYYTIGLVGRAAF